MVVYNSSNINNPNNHLSLQINEGEKDHDIWRWKSSSWLWTYTKMWRSVFILEAIMFIISLFVYIYMYVVVGDPIIMMGFRFLQPFNSATSLYMSKARNWIITFALKNFSCRIHTILKQRLKVEGKPINPIYCINIFFRHKKNA
jgi:hypothetical protein